VPKDMKDPINAGGSDGNLNTAEITSVDQIPESMKQQLIDQGVNIGFARGKEQVEKEGLPDKVVKKFLKDRNLTTDSFDSLVKLGAKKEYFDQLLEVYGVDTPEEALELITAAEKEEMSEVERIQAENELLLKQSGDSKGIIDQLKKSLEDSQTAKSERETFLYSQLQKHLVTDSLSRVAADLGAYDAQDIVVRLSGNLKLEEKDGKIGVVVLNDDNVPRLDAAGKYVSVKALVEEFLVDKPHLVKSGALPGSGNKGSGDVTTGGISSESQFTLEQIKDPAFFQDHRKEIMQEVRDGKLNIM